MATLIDPDFRARLRALNEKFAASVPATLASDLRRLARRCDADGPRLEPLTELHQALHAVAGSAATFGFARAGPGSARASSSACAPAQCPCAGGGGMAGRAGAGGGAAATGPERDAARQPISARELTVPIELWLQSIHLI